MVTEQQQWELISPQPTATETERQTLLQSLQRMTHDETLELRNVEAIESQTRWSFSGTSAGYRRIYTLFQSQQLPRLLELPVQQIAKVRKGAVPRSNVPPEQVLYRHVSDYAQTHPPDVVIKHLHHVLVEAHIEQLGELHEAIAALVLDKDAAEQFPTVLLKSFYQIIDVWQLDTQTRHQIPQLLTIFEHLPAIGFRQARTIRRLRELITVFLEHSAFQSLQRVCNLYNKPLAVPEQPLESLLARYASLYPYLVLPSESEYELNRTIRYCQERRQQHYSLRLSRFVMYYARLAEVAKARQLSHGAGRVIRRESNPTLLSDRDLASALLHFWRSTQGKPSQALRAERLRSDIHHLSSYGQFKDKLYAYLTKADCPPQQETFQILLQQQLQQILPSYETRKPSDSLNLRTATKLINFLVVENTNQRDHYFLIETVANLGATFTVGLLWKLILLCPSLETELNKRFALLFDHYAQFPQQEVHWLIQLLETYQLASSVHLGQVDLSPLTAMIRSKQTKPK